MLSVATTGRALHAVRRFLGRGNLDPDAIQSGNVGGHAEVSRVTALELLAALRLLRTHRIRVHVGG